MWPGLYGTVIALGKPTLARADHGRGSTSGPK
jgi:hypothetical protein